MSGTTADLHTDLHIKGVGTVNKGSERDQPVFAGLLHCAGTTADLHTMEGGTVSGGVMHGS